MRKICIQSGHWGMTTGATGAPREQERTIAIGLLLTEKLKALGVEAYRDDAFDDNDPHVNDTDWDLYLALHCDANYAGDEGGGFVDFIDLSIDSSVESNNESKRIMEAIEQVYFSESGIRNVPARRNPNTRFYYMWNVLSANTHCVIIEMGESIDPHDNVILNDTERVANALLHGIQNAFPDLKPATPPAPVESCQAYKDQIAKMSGDMTLLQSQYNTLALKDQECQKQAGIYKEEYDKANAPDGYKVQIAHLEEAKKLQADEISDLNRQVSYWQTKFNNLKKPGLKFIQAAVIAMCEKLGVTL